MGEGFRKCKRTMLITVFLQNDPERDRAWEIQRENFMYYHPLFCDFSCENPRNLYYKLTIIALNGIVSSWFQPWEPDETKLWFEPVSIYYVFENTLGGKRIHLNHFFFLLHMGLTFMLQKHFLVLHKCFMKDTLNSSRLSTPCVYKLYFSFSPILNIQWYQIDLDRFWTCRCSLNSP